MKAPRHPVASRANAGSGFARKSWPRRLAIFAALLSGGFLFTFPVDFLVYRIVQQIDRPVLERAAEQLSFWGDYWPGSLLVSLLLFIGSLVVKSRRARLAALASLLAATVAGLTLDSVRFSVGRPRPYATLAAATLRLGYRPEPKFSFGRTRPDTHLPDGFYGPLGIHMFQDFPSGHAASSTATAACVLRLLPEIGIPIGLLAAAVCWSRLELRQHYLSDVTVGAIWGTFWGILFGTLFSRGRPISFGEQLASRFRNEKNL
ncbi:hypothetical protein MAMC_00627 [Methylacidimicrobium cyclopophantes]|uniref:Phosphatidic acid phosphatase type 2/haloperoxidase domain-containing protein n=1 Tax=Methylacidimicrobium cyclopophantes TaxID=1041766 RepID=A0A5E6MHK6_9BACT|nr:phosphatase PAP2 family protein [Methylacidimicrobium cyclopophantes]VVM05495.1 hypothetical protein MAMC_00627 [Methylacidimicrobium cyclopophantes]